jgi:hypothetical protein
MRHVDEAVGKLLPINQSQAANAQYIRLSFTAQRKLVFPSYLHEYNAWLNLRHQLTTCGFNNVIKNNLDTSPVHEIS